MVSQLKELYGPAHRQPAEFLAHTVITLPDSLSTTRAFAPQNSRRPPVCPTICMGLLTVSLMASTDTPTPSREIA